MKPIFLKYRSIKIVVPLLLVLCVSFFVFDGYLDYSSKVRAFFMKVALPVYWVADIPRKITQFNEDWFTSKARLAQQKEALAIKVLVLEGRLQKMAQLTIQNTRLRSLLKSSSILQENVLVAEVIGVSPSRYNDFMIINKGEKDNVYVGQSVLDSKGLLGQVLEVNASSSRVLLITDNKHAVPVQVNRSGVRGIVEGKSNESEMDMVQVPLTADVRVGDLLISSGLAGHFPRGYPVAVVTQANKTKDQFFFEIKVRPLADINSSRFVLLVVGKHDDNIETLLSEDILESSK